MCVCACVCVCMSVCVCSELLGETRQRFNTGSIVSSASSRRFSRSFVSELECQNFLLGSTQFLCVCSELLGETRQRFNTGSIVSFASLRRFSRSCVAELECQIFLFGGSANLCRVWSVVVRDRFQSIFVSRMYCSPTLQDRLQLSLDSLR